MNATDLLVIGGGPAGLAAAIAARRRGLDVLVADAAVPPIDKARGEGIIPNGFGNSSMNVTNIVEERRTSRFSKCPPDIR